MVRRFFAAAAVCAAMFCSAAPASAAALISCSSGAGIDLVNDGCISGKSNVNPGGNDGLSAVQAAIFAATGVAPVNLSFYGKSKGNTALFSLSDPSPTGYPGTWNILDDDILIKYVTVKAATGFALYEISGQGANSGVFTTAGMLNKGGNEPEVSHVSFWLAETSAVPEPATWAMMMLGLGFVGGALRSRRRAESLAFIRRGQV